MTATHAACDRRLAQLETQLADAKACCDTMREQRDAATDRLLRDQELAVAEARAGWDLALAEVTQQRDDALAGLRHARQELRRHAAAEASA